MTIDAQQKVTAHHLRRNAYLYVRQSSLRQVIENTESTERQYALRQRAIALGWSSDRILVIDRDLGQSGASAADREGFQELVTAVGLGQAGIVMGLEVSRLARNSTDWHRLLEMCALSDTLILDEDGIYDPAHFNDRLLLGLKGTMSEAELHILRARLQGGILNKARRGELPSPVPVGFVYDSRGQVVLDPDRQVQDSIRFLFEAFRRTGSALGVVKAFRQQGLQFPRRMRRGVNKGQILWGDLLHSGTLRVLHNPRYTGAFFYGRTRHRRLPDGRHVSSQLPREEWTALVRDAHEGYISWEEYERNQQQLRGNSAAHGTDRRRSPPREGPALLQGRVICGKCGRRMSVRYHERRGRLVPAYTCARNGIERGEPICQTIPGQTLDAATGQLLIEMVTPVALEAALTVQEELQARIEEVDRLRLKHVERARYEAQVARHRYMQVDPSNRLVADALEAEWNARLREAQDAQEQYEQSRKEERAVLDEDQRRRILDLATDFPRLWKMSATPQRERKRMLRLLIDDVTLIKGKEITAHVRFCGGTTRTLSVSLPLCAWKLRQTDPAVVAQVDALLNHHTEKQIACILNEGGHRSGEGKALTGSSVARIRRTYGLRTRYDRLREAGLLTADEIAMELGISRSTVGVWRRQGRLTAVRCDDKGECLYEPLGPERPVKYEEQRNRYRSKEPTVCADRADGVQSDA